MIDSCIRLTLEIGGSGMPVTVKAKRGDTGRVLRIDLSDGGLPYRISEDCYGVFTGRKPDGTTLCHACTIENNMVVYTFTEQTCAAAGCITAEIRLYGSDDKLLTSASFLLEVQDTVWHAGDVESRDQMDALDQLILETVALKQEVEEKLGNGDFTGPQGPAGPRGEKGDRGEPGAAGKTPVKGEDYFTEEDQQELVEAVIEELPEDNMWDNLPAFDLNEMGMPVLTLDGTSYYCECDTTELMAALDRSIVRISADIDNGTKVFKGEAFFMQAMSVSEDIHQAIVRGTINDVDDFYDFRLLVREGIIYLSATPDAGGGSCEIPAFNLTEMGLPVLSLDGAKAKAETDTTALRAALASGLVKATFNLYFNGVPVTVTSIDRAHYVDAEDTYQVCTMLHTIRNDAHYMHLGVFNVRSTGITACILPVSQEGKTPEKGVDYWTEEDKAEMVDAVLAALPTWTGGSY